MPVDITFFLTQCHDTCALLRDAPEPLQRWKETGILNKRYREGMLAVLSEFPKRPDLTDETFVAAIHKGADDLVERHHRATGGILIRAAFVYAWCALDELAASAIRELRTVRPDLVSGEEARGFIRWRPKDQLALLHRIGFKLDHQCQETFRRFASLRNKAAHDVDFVSPPPNEAETYVGRLSVAGQNFALMFCKQFRVRFRFPGKGLFPSMADLHVD